LHTSVGSNIIISNTASFFTLIIGSFFKIEEFSVGKLLAVFITVSGVAIVSYKDTKISTSTLVGDLLGLFSALCYGAYTVFLKKKIKNEKKANMPLFFGYVGAWIALLLWPLLIILNYIPEPYGETFEWPKPAVFRYLLLNGFIGTVISDLLWSLAILLTSPLIATFGLSCSVPLALLTEHFWKGKAYSWIYVLGSVLVISGFLIVNVTSKKKEVALWLKLKKMFGKKTSADGGDTSFNADNDVNNNSDTIAINGEPIDSTRDAPVILED